MIKVLNPGLATSVQDMGRHGYYHLGIPQSGGMDQLALQAANLLVGNASDAAVLEATFMGPELEFTADAVVAVTGAAMTPKVDGAEQANWESFAVKAGQVLSFDYLKGGARAYIAVSGGIDVPVVLVTDRSGAQFYADTWKVAPEADRIGYRFRGGHPIEFTERERPFGAGSDPSNIVDGCYPYGSIQVPGGTEPIILHRDAVSGGGYFMLGTVISADMDLIGEALEARADRNALLKRIQEALA